MSIGYVVIILFHSRYRWCAYLFLSHQSVVGFTHFVDHFKEPVLVFLLSSVVCFLFRPLFIYFWLHWVFRVVLGFSVAALGLCLVVVSRGHSSCGAHASHCGGFSYGGEWALWHVGSAAVGHGLSCPMARGILAPGPGIEPVSTALAGGFLTTGPPEKSLRQWF